MRLKDKWCDVTIKVDGKEIRAHKVILAANLKYFETMFSSDSFQESQNGVITMKSVEKTNLELFVSYAYTGEILLTNSNALSLLELANYLSEDGIKGACVEFLEKNLKAEDACQAYKFANIVGSNALKNAAKTKIIANFGNCSRSDDYVNLDSESLMNILSDTDTQSNQLKITLFEGVMKWILYDAKVRKSFLVDLLSSVDISRLKSDDITRSLYKNLVHLNDDYGITRDALMYYEASKIESEKQEQLSVIDIAGSLQSYNFIKKKWSSQQKIPDAAVIVYESSAVLNDKLCFISNISGTYHLQALDLLSKQITRLHSLSSILSCATLCACSKFLYICGGKKEDDSPSDQVLRYDPQIKSFATLASIGTAREAAACIFDQGYLYVLGGYDGSYALQSVERYDPVRNEWTAFAPMCRERYGHAVAKLNGKLYACGGYSGQHFKSSVEVYDPATNNWQLIASMNKERAFFFLVAHDDKLLAIGGIGEKTAEVYDPSKNQWKINHEMSSDLNGGRCIGGLFPFTCITNTQ